MKKGGGKQTKYDDSDNESEDENEDSDEDDR